VSGSASVVKLGNTIIDHVQKGVYRICASCGTWNQHSETYFDNVECEVYCTVCGDYEHWVYIPDFGRPTGTWQVSRTDKFTKAERDLIMAYGDIMIINQRLETMERRIGVLEDNANKSKAKVAKKKVAQPKRAVTTTGNTNA
jgi:hypothetical protein